MAASKWERELRIEFPLSDKRIWRTFEENPEEVHVPVFGRNPSRSRLPVGDSDDRNAQDSMGVFRLVRCVPMPKDCDVEFSEVVFVEKFATISGEDEIAFRSQEARRIPGRRRPVFLELRMALDSFPPFSLEHKIENRWSRRNGVAGVKLFRFADKTLLRGDVRAWLLLWRA